MHAQQKSGKPLIARDFSLKKFNTFGVDVRAREYAHFASVDDLRQCLEIMEMSPFILGGGSNILLTKDLPYCVLHHGIGGIEVVSDHTDHVVIQVGGGVVWHDLVLWAVRNDLGGIENLALIPGMTGAAPIQNIGAYGVELTEVFVRLEALDLSDRHLVEFEREDCAFAYRDSIFKNQYKGKYCVARITLRLTKPPHTINDSYGVIREILKAQNIDRPSIADICNTVIAIRTSKLPDPAVLGNAGSFFKNPTVDEGFFNGLAREWQEMPSYPAGGEFKIPAGWLIEKCGWKGLRVGNVGCHEKQALVIVNYGSATGMEIYDHAMRVKASVQERFGITLEEEVNVL